MRTLKQEVPIYVTVGLLSAAVDLGTYALLAEGFGLHPLAANLVSRPLGGGVGFTLHKLWTFRGRGRSRTHVQFIKFWIVWGTSFALSELLVGVLHEGLQLGPLPTKIGAEGLVSLLTFLLQRFWTFA